MRNVFFILFMSFGVAGFSQETYCANPNPNNTNTSAALNFTATSIPTTAWKYWTTSTITTTGNINLSNNKLYSQTSIRLQSGFKATSTGNKIVAGVGNCSTPSARIVNEPSKEKDLRDNELGEHNEIFVYPNPNNGNFTVNVGAFMEGEISIFDSSGKLIFNTTFSKEPIKGINVSDLASGIYIVKVTENGISETRKIAIK